MSHQQVLGLDVSVHDVLQVEEAQPLHDLPCVYMPCGVKITDRATRGGQVTLVGTINSHRRGRVCAGVRGCARVRAEVSATRLISEHSTLSHVLPRENGQKSKRRLATKKKKTRPRCGTEAHTLPRACNHKQNSVHVYAPAVPRLAFVRAHGSSSASDASPGA